MLKLGNCVKVLINRDTKKYERNYCDDTVAITKCSSYHSGFK